MQKLPIGIQSFEDIRKENYLYVDKTKQILKMIENGKCYFLSRPRRFGKSLTISTLEAMFKGEVELFKGLYAEEWVKEQAKNPAGVIRIDMGHLTAYKNSDELNDSIVFYLEKFVEKNKLDVSLNQKAGKLLLNIISVLYEQFASVVVLIDEYDKPITDNIDNLEKANEMRETLRPFYGLLKDCKEVKFVFITGISKFSKTGIFSGFNNLKDISMTEKYSDIVGYTQKELEDNFVDFFEQPMKKFSFTKEELLEKIKDYYDGFSFDGKVRVYNPFSVLNFFDDSNFDNYWYDSGMPSFLAKYLKEHKIKEPKEYIQKRVTSDFISSQEIENTSVESFLYQAGYLTIKERRGNILILDYPNEEVSSSMDRLYLDNFYNIKDFAGFSNDIWLSLESENISQIVNIFNEALKGVPYDDYKNRDEAWYRSLFLMLLSGAKITYFSEVHTFKGRSDVVIVFKEKIIVLEFKFAKNSRGISYQRKKGKEQIESRDYASTYKSTKKVITAVFIANDEKRQVVI